MFALQGAKNGGLRDECYKLAEIGARYPLLLLLLTAQKWSARWTMDASTNGPPPRVFIWSKQEQGEEGAQSSTILARYYPNPNQQGSLYSMVTPIRLLCCYSGTYSSSYY
jgi:hypothetical protein